MSMSFSNCTDMVIAMSNTSANFVSSFARDCGGTLHFMGVYPTNGSGTALANVDPLGSQGALALSACGQFLFAVNSADNTISSMWTNCAQPQTIAIAPSGGAMPVSLTVCGNLLYALNAGNANNASNVTGFVILSNGQLWPIPDSTQALSIPNAAPACVVFAPDGRTLVVSEKASSKLTTFAVQAGGTLRRLAVNNSNGATPFGMAFTACGILLVAEAGPNALSSYRLDADGSLTVISGSVPNAQTATCWVAVTPDGRFAYTTNAGSGTISVYYVTDNGKLALLENVPSTPGADGAPIDCAVDRCGRHLYVLNGAQGSISMLRIGADGHPWLLQVYQNTQLPQKGAQGIVAF